MRKSRRELLLSAGKYILLTGTASAGLDSLTGTVSADTSDSYKMAEHWWGMTMEVDKCIGCGNCVRACAKENDVPDGFFRTWIERYHVKEGDIEHPTVESPNGGKDGFPPASNPLDKSFFIPKLCNHCSDSPCTQVCPVGATFVSPDGVVMVDQSYCLGCRYCVQACPYGCRYIHPTKQVVDKCNLCYHRITKGLTTACCEACPTGAQTRRSQKPRRSRAYLPAHLQSAGAQTPHGHALQVFYKDLDGSVR